MKSLLLVFLIGLFANLINAQIVFEHQYSGTVNRVNLQHAGEKYYRYNPQTQAISFFNADHTTWKSFSLPFDTTGSYAVYGVSDQKFNSDLLIEITCTFFSNGKPQVLIVNELGTVLFKTEGQSALLTEIPGLATKLMVQQSFTSTAVYSVPQLQLEHQFPLAARRQLLDSVDDVYIGVESDTMVRIYDSKFSLYRSVAIPSVIVGPNIGVTHISRNKIISDTLIEIVIRKLQSQAVIINELGTILHTSYNAYNFQISEIPGYPNKLCDYEAVYTLPGLIKEHTYKGFHPFRQKFGVAPYYVMGWNDTVRIYNSNHSLKAKIKANVTSGLTLASWCFFTDNLINLTSDLEVGYGGKNFSSPNFGETRIIGENGTNLFMEPQGKNLNISEIGGGTQNKLMSYLIDSIGNLGVTKIYALPSYDLTNIKKFVASGSDLVIFPNPATDYFELKINNLELRRIRIYSAGGSLISDTPIDETDRVKIDNLNQGIYIIVFEDRAGKSIPKKLVKQ